MSGALAASTVDPLVFYEVAATVLPVLFLALILQARTHQMRPLRIFGRMMLAAFLTVYFIEGEYVSFRVLALGHPSNTTRDHVVVALVAEGIFVALQPMWDILAWADRRLAAAIGRGAVEPVSHRRRYLLLGSLAAALFVVPVVTLLLWDLVA